MSFNKEQLKNWLGKYAIYGGNVLSVGCMDNDGQYFGTFSPEEFVTLDINLEFKPHYFCDFNEPLLKYLPNNLRGRFDHVLTIELWDYIYNLPQALQNCYDALKLGGTLWISGNFVYPQHDNCLVRQSKVFWEKYLPKYGFQIMELRPKFFKEPDLFYQLVSKDGIRLDRSKEHNTLGFMIKAMKINQT